MTTEPIEFKALRGAALALPEVEEGSSCNKIAFKARKKAFLYLGQQETTWNLMLKLSDSVEDVDGVAGLAEDFIVNEHGWVSATFARGQSLPGELTAWVEESYRALAPKSLVKLLDGPSRD